MPQKHRPIAFWPQSIKAKKAQEAQMIKENSFETFEPFCGFNCLQRWLLIAAS
jgi:hypothetical protein